jgi:hypothetical protein
MITINTIPQRNLGVRTLEWAAPNLNGFDLSELQDGYSLTNAPEDCPIISVERTGDDYLVSVLVDFDPALSEQARLDPQEYQLTADGLVGLPIYGTKPGDVVA